MGGRLMAWLRIDDGLAEHRKLIELKRPERWTWMEVLCYVARQNNGGHVPPGIVDVLRHVSPAFLDRCSEIGLLDTTPDGGYVVHDWAEYNSNDAAHRDRQKRYRNRKRDGEGDADVTDA